MNHKHIDNNLNMFFFSTNKSEMQNFRSLVNLPWTIKLLYGLTIDSLPLFGYKRKSYMLLFGIIAPLSTLITITWAKYYYVQLVFMTINAFSVSFCDVIADALTVERTEFKSHCVATRLQSLAWGCRYMSSVIGLLISTQIEVSNKPKDMIIVYWSYFFVSLSISICAFLLPEKRIKKRNSNRQNEMELVQDHDESQHSDDSNDNNNNPNYSLKQILYLTFETVCRRSIFYPLLFTFILRCTPTTDEALDYYLIYELGFSSIWIGYLKVAGSVAFIIAIVIITYQSRNNNPNFSLRKLYFSWTIIAAILPFMTLIIVFKLNEKLNIPNIYFMLSDKVVVMTAADILQMGINVLYARLCPPGIEGVFMTILTSISNIGMILNYQISSWIIKLLNIKCDQDPNDENSVICNFKYLWLLIIIVNLTTLLPLILIKKVPNEQELQKVGDELNKATSESITDAENMVIGKNVDRSKMIKMYGIGMDYVFPFFKKRICCCCCNDNDNKNKNNEIQLSSIVNNNNRNVSNTDNDNKYSEIEMR